MFRYYLIGLQTMFKNSFVAYSIITVHLIFLLILFRRLTMVLRSGGPFSAPYHISDGNFYIHNAFTLSKRIIPLNDIKLIKTYRIRGNKMSGERYMLFIERKQGRKIVVIFGASKKNDALVANLKKETKKYPITISKGLYD